MVLAASPGAAQAEAIAAEQKLVCDCFGKAMSAIVDKDVSYRINDDLPEAYHRLFRWWFALGWPAFAGVLGVYWLMIAKPVL